jgi:hypothetical protein
MTTTLRARFDGKVLVPEEAIDLPVGQTLTFHLEPAEQTENTLEHTGLQRLAELALQFEADPDAPVDGAAQHDHYLYGTPKRENP